MHIFRQTGGYAVWINRRIVQAFWLQEDVMGILASEPDDLVLDRWTIAWPPTGELAGINRRSVNVFSDDRMGRGGRAGHAAFYLSVGQA